MPTPSRPSSLAGLLARQAAEIRKAARQSSPGLSTRVAAAEQAASAGTEGVAAAQAAADDAANTAAQALTVASDAIPYSEKGGPSGVAVNDRYGIDVRDPRWGAVGNGMNNDAPAIQAALDFALSGTTPAPVFIPPGAYRLYDPVTRTGSVEVRGAGPERTVITPPAGGSAFVLGSLSQSQPHGLTVEGMTFRHNSPANTDAPILDIQQYGRKWVVDRCYFDGAFSNRPAIRVYTSWVGSIRDCNFWRLGGEGLAGQRAAVIVKPASISATALGPINNLTLTDCAWERVQLAVDLHDSSDLTGSSSIYSVEIRNGRFKNSSTSGPTPNSVGIQSNSNSTFNVVVSTPFFEDFDTCIVARGHGWVIQSPFVQSASMGVHIVAGSAIVVEGLIMQGSVNNEIAASVVAEAGIGVCEVRRWKNVGTVAGPAPVDNSGGKLVVTAA